MSSYIDGLADAVIDGNARRARSAANDAERKAASAEADAGRSQQTAAMMLQQALEWRDTAWEIRGEAEGFKSLFLHLYNTHIKPLPEPEREDARQRMVAAARTWINERCNDDCKRAIRTTWLGPIAKDWNSWIGLVDVPPPPPPPPAPAKPVIGQVERAVGLFGRLKTFYQVAGVDHKSQAAADAALAGALSKWRSDCAAWAARHGLSDPSAGQ